MLISMPFASVRYPSPALSLLKPLVQKNAGVPCDILYLNILFQAFTGLPKTYEGIADFMIIGEWVFGEELFGKEWAQSNKGELKVHNIPLLPEGLNLESLHNSFYKLRSKAQAFIQKCMDTIKWHDYSIIGFTSVYSQNVASLALAQHIKKLWPEKIIAFGGANCEEEMGQALLRLFPFVDWVFNGEADLSFPQAVYRWINYGTSPEGISGVVYRQDGHIIVQNSGQSPEMDKLPYPVFDDYFAALYKWLPQYLPYAPISTEFSRGCWWGKKSQCIFCGLNCKKLDFRTKSPQRAKDEINTLTSNYKVNKIILTDSSLDKKFFKTLLPAIAQQGGLEEMFIETKANLKREDIRLLSSAGVKYLQPGIESLDTEILTYMRKGTTLLQNVQFLKWAREYEVCPTWNFLYGFPGENPEAYRRMSMLIPLIVHLYPPMDLSPALLVRFSPLFENSQQWGLRNIRAHSAYQCIYPFDQEDLDQLAYFFEYEAEGKEHTSSYISPLKKQVKAWKQYWEDNTPPLLTYEQLSEEKIIIHDNRPCQIENIVELEGIKAVAYLACDAKRKFDSLSREIKSQMGKDYPGDDTLHYELNSLVKQRLILRESKQYLSLALSSSQIMDVSEQW